MSGAAVRLARPNISNIQKNDLYKNIYISVGTGFVGGLWWWFGYAKGWQRKYENFMATYDPYEDFERMRKLGLFQGAPPDEVIEEMKTMQKFKNKFK